MQLKLSFRQESLHSSFFAAPKKQIIFILEQLKRLFRLSPVVIASLSFQLLGNEEDNRQVAKIAKEIVANGGCSTR